jgi:hypothetical protein
LASITRLLLLDYLSFALSREEAEQRQYICGYLFQQQQKMPKGAEGKFTLDAQ